MVGLFSKIMLFAQFESPVTMLGASGMTVKLETNTTTVTITLTGPDNSFLAVGFGVTNMFNVADAFIWNGTPSRDYNMSGGLSAPNADANQDWTIVSDDVAGTTRTVVATRTLASPSGDMQDYTFTNAAGSFSIIYARASTTMLSYHSSRGTAIITLACVNPTALPLPITNVTATQNITAGNTFFNSSCTDLIAGVQSTATGTDIAGSTTSKVWLQPNAPGGLFVRRHYEITPTTNAATATGRVTLYFTQADFDDFNAASVVDLPASSSDIAGISNLRIEKQGGISNNNTGLPGTYPGAAETINPNDADIVWNSTANRWEVSFDVTGFSGFFVKTNAVTLPITLRNFTIIKQSTNNMLAWQLTANNNIKYVDIEASSNGTTFTKIATVNTVSGVQDYNYIDNSLQGDVVFYRLKMTDEVNNVTVSNIIRTFTNKFGGVVLYPNVVKNTATLQVLDASLIGTQAILSNVKGNVLQRISITTNQQLIDLSKYAAGVYVMRFNNGNTLKLIKQ
jgi:hypothetical protein